MKTHVTRGIGVGVAAGSLAMAGMFSLALTGHAAETLCVPTSAAPTLEVAAEPVPLGGGLLVTGTGWCHPTDGGSRVALKIDEGAFARLDTSVHANTTIWTIVEADPQDGSFSELITLPDGTDLTSKPAFVEGTHTLRALSGSIKADDVMRTVKSNEFVVGEYSPNGPAEPVGTDDLDPEAKDMVLGVWREDRLLVSVAGGTEGRWIQPSLLAKDGSARRPWAAEWFRLDAAGRVLLPPAVGEFVGDHTLVVQSGDEDTVHEVLGWSPIDFSAAGDGTGDKPSGPTSSAPKPDKDKAPAKSTKPTFAPQALIPPSLRAPLIAPPSAPPASVAPPAAALPQTPAAPYPSWSQMDAQDELTAVLERDRLTIQLGYGAGGDVSGSDVHVHVSTQQGQSPAGWTTATGGVVELSTAELAAGEYRFSLQNAAGTPLGWVSAVLESGSGVADSGATEPLVIQSVASPGPVGERDLWLAGLGMALVVGLGAGVGASRLAAGRPRARTQRRQNEPEHGEGQSA